MEQTKNLEKESFDEDKKIIDKTIESEEIPISYISELTTDKGWKLHFSHYGKDKNGNHHAYYTLD